MGLKQMPHCGTSVLSAPAPGSMTESCDEASASATGVARPVRINWGACVGSTTCGLVPTPLVGTCPLLQGAACISGRRVGRNLGVPCIDDDTAGGVFGTGAIASTVSIALSAGPCSGNVNTGGIVLALFCGGIWRGCRNGGGARRRAVETISSRRSPRCPGCVGGIVCIWSEAMFDLTQLFVSRAPHENVLIFLFAPFCLVLLIYANTTRILQCIFTWCDGCLS